MSESAEAKRSCPACQIGIDRKVSNTLPAKLTQREWQLVGTRFTNENGRAPVD